MLATACRQIDIASLSLLHMKKFDKKMLLNIPRACKIYKCAFFMNQMVTLEQFPNKIVCPMRTLKKYISRTEKLHNTTKMFIATTPLFKAASTQNLQWWIHDVMQASGVDMTVFTHILLIQLPRQKQHLLLAA